MGQMFTYTNFFKELCLGATVGSLKHNGHTSEIHSLTTSVLHCRQQSADQGPLSTAGSNTLHCHGESRISALKRPQSVTLWVLALA